MRTIRNVITQIIGSVRIGFVLLGFTTADIALSQPASAYDYSRWAVVIVAGSDVNQDGVYIPVFDNARVHLAHELSKIGFSQHNIHQLSVRPDSTSEPATIGAISAVLKTATGEATEGCMIYVTSHGARNAGILIGHDLLTPKHLANMVNYTCGNRPSMIVMSACYTGQFVVPLMNSNRLVLTAARSTKMSWDCTSPSEHNCFDGCFLHQLANVRGDLDLTKIARDTIECVGTREQRANISTPSEPQIYAGKDFAQTASIAQADSRNRSPKVSSRNAVLDGNEDEATRRIHQLVALYLLMARAQPGDPPLGPQLVQERFSSR